MSGEFDLSRWLARDLSDFYEQLYRQVSALFSLSAEERVVLESVRPKADEWFLTVCAAARNKFYETPASLWPLHNSQFAIFLYIVARTLFAADGRSQTALRLCDKLYNLNKMVSGFEAHYAVELPRIFFTDHPYGTGLGRTRYGNHFAFIQGVTVGNYQGVYPTFGDCVCLMSHCKVLGRCNIGNNVIIAANAFVKNTDIPDDSIVFGQDRDLVIKTGRGEENRAFFRKVFSDL